VCGAAVKEEETPGICLAEPVVILRQVISFNNRARASS
jgi:hypothetical protein